jgi:hypothetical protein
MSPLLLAAAALGTAAPDPALVSVEPRPARRWEQSVTLSCGSSRYRIAGYGVVYPDEMPARVSVDGRPVRGAPAELLRRDLSMRGAAYRIAGLCGRGSSDLDLLVYRGIATGGSVTYHSGAARITSRGEVIYTGLEPSDAQTYWFR